MRKNGASGALPMKVLKLSLGDIVSPEKFVIL
jgi:hypothetical protein